MVSPMVNINDRNFYFFRGEVYSSKNSKRVIRTGNTSRIIASAAVQRYLKNHTAQFECKKSKALFIEETRCKLKPLYVGFYFIRETKRAFDYNNMSQLIADLLVEYEWISDDNCNEFIPVFLGYYVLNKNEKNVQGNTNAGVLITLVNNEHKDTVQIEYVKDKCFVRS